MNKLGCFAVVFLMLGCSMPRKDYGWCGFNEDYSYVEFTPDAALQETLLGLVKLPAGAEPREPNLWKIKNELEVIACEGNSADGCGAMIDHFVKRESGWEFDTSEFIQCHFKP